MLAAKTTLEISVPASALLWPSYNPPRERDAAPHRPTQKPTPKRCPLPHPGKTEKPAEDNPPAPGQDRQLPLRPGPLDSEYTYYSSEEEGTDGQVKKKLQDYPAGSLISRLLPTSPATTASSESGSYESSWGPSSAATRPPLICGPMHALIIDAACPDTVPQLLRQHRDQAEYADRPWQAGLRHPFSACHLLSCSLPYTDAPSWVLQGTEIWLALVCTDVPISAVKSAEGASGNLHTCYNRLLLLIVLGPAAGPMASSTAQLPALQPRRRPRNSPHFEAATACLLQPANEHLCQEFASLASWLTGTSGIPTTAKLGQTDREHAWELHAMDVDEEEEHIDHHRPRPVNPRFLTGLSGARRHGPVFAGEVRSRGGPPLTRFHPGLAAPLPDDPVVVTAFPPPALAPVADGFLYSGAALENHQSRQTSSTGPSPAMEGQTPTSPTAVPAALPLQLAWTSDRLVCLLVTRTLTTPSTCSSQAYSGVVITIRGLASLETGHMPPQTLLYAWPAASLCENASYRHREPFAQVRPTAGIVGGFKSRVDVLAQGFVAGTPIDAGVCGAVQGQLKNVQQIQATNIAFATILGDGSVVTWGDGRDGGDSRAVQGQLKTVQQIVATKVAFAAILGDGSVVTWGNAGGGGDSSAVQEHLKNRQVVQYEDFHVLADLMHEIRDLRLEAWHALRATVPSPVGENDARRRGIFLMDGHGLSKVCGGVQSWHPLQEPILRKATLSALLVSLPCVQRPIAKATLGILEELVESNMSANTSSTILCDYILGVVLRLLDKPQRQKWVSLLVKLLMDNDDFPKSTVVCRLRMLWLADDDPIRTYAAALHQLQLFAESNLEWGYDVKLLTQ
ncbi:unnamed protein product, partial [Symbiodinium microadriaticum]